MQCLKCQCTSFTAKNIPVETKNKEYFAFAWVCDNCEEPLMDTSQMTDAIRKFKTPDERKREANEKANERWVKKDKLAHEQKVTHPWKKFCFKKGIKKPEVDNDRMS